MLYSDIYYVTNMTDQKQQLKEWVIQNMIDIEAGNLDEEKTKLFLDLAEKNADQEFMQECFTEFEKRKEEEEEDIVFCCTGCDKQIIRNSEDHDFSKFDPENEDNWYCVSCPVPEEEEEEEEEEEDQYKQECPECECILTEKVPIMCFMNKEDGDLTLCNECYWDCEYWKTDENEDNEDEIKEHKEEEE